MKGAGDCAARMFRCLRRPDDVDGDDARRRTVLPVMAITGLTFILTTALKKGTPSVYTIGSGIIVAAMACGILFILLRLRGSYSTLIGFLALPVVTGILLTDLYNASYLQGRTWALIVLILDALVVFGARLSVQAAALGMAVAYLAALSAESTLVYGLYHIGHWEAGGGHDGGGNEEGGHHQLPVCDCGEPPCAIPATEAWLSWWVPFMVFAMDFYITRGFAAKLQTQMSVIAATVKVSERVAELLAVYLTDDARRVVAEAGLSLPAGLRDSYGQLFDNLDSYRPFIPDSLLVSRQQQQHEQQHTEASPSTQSSHSPRGSVISSVHQSRSAPGLGEPAAHLAVCFTDIQSSTELWEAAPQGMYDGLNIHNRVMRDTLAACDGYEVKTIGDSFMVVFETSLNALRFGLEAQLELLRQHWPEDLLAHPLCSKDAAPSGELLWGGLRVRVGVQFGPTRVECNPVTTRCDYFGPTVNMAARLESVLRRGGLVATTDAVMQGVGDALLTLGPPAVRDIGDCQLRGVKEKQHVWLLVPQVLQQRMDIVDDAALQTTPHREQASPRLQGAGEGRAQGRGSARSSISDEALAVSGGRRYVGPPGAQLLKLQRSMATAAAARAALIHCEPVADRLPLFVSAASMAADQTYGVVDTVLSATVVVSWNVSRPCVEHAASCHHFLASPFKAPCHLGASSGTVLSGGISTGRRSYIAVAGGCVDLAAALAEEADRCGDAVLAAGAVADYCAAQGEAHCAQLWQPPRGAAMLVLEVHSTKGEDRWMLDDADGVPRGGGNTWSSEFTALFRRACTAEPGSPEAAAILGELGRLPEHAATASDAARLKLDAEHLAERFTRSAVRIRLMPNLWEPEPRAQSDATANKNPGWGKLRALTTNPLTRSAWKGR
eukprot:TRINITY_DN6869_c0_g3_i1.p1 TRINITY_DN6869_c0_g3~~TRINITY_DN6869_c0_g3_i1.p1  ORF type:complete len:893 (+),score=245.90 TRINITY_DN6869_c0_g3_i1:139-2817(+)